MLFGDWWHCFSYIVQVLWAQIQGLYKMVSCRWQPENLCKVLECGNMLDDLQYLKFCMYVHIYVYIFKLTDGNRMRTMSEKGIYITQS